MVVIVVLNFVSRACRWVIPYDLWRGTPQQCFNSVVGGLFRCLRPLQNGPLHFENRSVAKVSNIRRRACTTSPIAATGVENAAVDELMADGLSLTLLNGVVHPPLCCLQLLMVRRKERADAGRERHVFRQSLEQRVVVDQHVPACARHIIEKYYG